MCSHRLLSCAILCHSRYSGYDVAAHDIAHGVIHGLTGVMPSLRLRHSLLHLGVVLHIHDDKQACCSSYASRRIPYRHDSPAALPSAGHALLYAFPYILRHGPLIVLQLLPEVFLKSVCHIDVVYDVLGFLVGVRLLVRPVLTCHVLSAPCLPSRLWATAVALPVAMVIHCGGVL